MAITDLHDLAEKLHNIDQERSLNAVENDSIKITRRLAIDLVRHMTTLNSGLLPSSRRGGPNVHTRTHQV
jgi:hypothetical protein